MIKKVISIASFIILYNPASNNGRGEAEVKSLYNQLEGNDLRFLDITRVESINSVVHSLSSNDKLIIAGGDGTLNRFFNNIEGLDIKNEVFFFATGYANDFMSSLSIEKGNLVELNPFFGKLPTVTVNGNDRKFINGVGFGLDGYCCEVADRMRKKNKPVNYLLIAVKALLFRFKPIDATVTVDGKTERFSHMWMAPTVFGRFYGGGLIPVPEQNREEGTVSTMVFHDCGKFKAVTAFPSIFTGELSKKEKIVTILKGKSVTVEFDQPATFLIDGKTVSNVTSYTVKFDF